MGEILTLGAARVRDTDDTPIPPVVRGLLEGSDDPSDISDEGEVPFMCALGLTALPAPKDASGHAEGNFEPAPCYGSVCVGARDTRCSDVYGKLKAGETAVYNTGGDVSKRSRLLLKEDCASIIVGNNVVVMVDRKNSKIQIAAFGHMFQMTTNDGIVMTAGVANGATSEAKNGIQLMPNGKVYIWGTELYLGGHNVPSTPANAVLMGPSGMAGIPATNVFIVPG
jgi:hypothetical protein